MVLAMTPGDGRALDGCALDRAQDGLGAVLAAAPSGAGLAALLESITSTYPGTVEGGDGPSDHDHTQGREDTEDRDDARGLRALGDHDLLDLAAGWARLIGWATAQQAAVAGELGRRRAWSVEHAHAAVELGARLGVPGPEADRVMARGAGLGRHREVAAALVSASIDTVKADLLLTAGKTLTIEQRQAAIEDVLPQAPQQSRRWVRDKMNEHARRHQTPAQQTTSELDARAVYLDPVDGGSMAWLSAHLPATDAAAVWATLDTAGQAIKRAGKDRTIAQARADALTAILTGRLIVPTTPRCAPQETTPPTTGTTGSAAGTTSATLAGTPATATATDTATGTTDVSAVGPATAAATGPATGTTDLSAGGPATATATGPATGATDLSAGGPATVPGYVPGIPRTTAPAPARSGNPDPGSPEGSDADASSVGDQDPRSTAEVGCVCGGCLCGATRITVLPVRAQVRVTVAASTLAGGDDEPGYLDGYGPVHADTAALLATDGTWRRLVTDPFTGVLTDHSTHTYAPGAVLRQAVIERDATCQFPQCDRPARATDLDHITTFNHALDPATLPPGAPGQTRAANLQSLCRRHHNAKTHHGWTAARDSHTGTTVWTAPTGHTYTRLPTQLGKPTTGAGTATGAPTRTEGSTSLRDHDRRLLGRAPQSERPTAADVLGMGTSRDAPAPGEPPF